ncbi:MAG: tetratricopeptide repeat protein [Bacteroidota bacterium]|nr:tetratricopeptide repeat protein [Bacteroidota bacterium]
MEAEENTLVSQINLLNESSWNQKYSDTNKAYELATQALELSIKIEYSKGKAYAELHQMVCSFLMSKINHLLLQKLIEVRNYFGVTGDKLGESRALNYIGNFYENIGEYEKGLAMCQEGLKVSEAIDYKEGIADVLSTTGNLYTRLGDFEHALDSYNKSLLIRESQNELKAVGSSLNLIARTYTAIGDFTNGLKYYQKSIALREELNEKGAIPWSYLGMAALYEKKKDLDVAFKYYSKCIELNDNDKRLNLHCLIGMGKICLNKNETEKGIDNLQNALLIATEIKAKPLQYEINGLLAQLYESKNDATKALQHFKEYHNLKEEVLNIESNNRLKNQQISFAVEQSEKETEIHRLKNVELKALNDKIAEKNKDISDSINYAKRIQLSLLPDLMDVRNVFSKSFVLFKPKDIVSGDFYWFQTIADSNSKGGLIAAADCTGHGVPGAFMSTIGVEKLNDAVLQTQNPGSILQLLNRAVKKSLRQGVENTNLENKSRDGMDIALLKIEFTDEGARLNYAGANRPLWIIHGGIEFQETKATKTAIGGFTEDDQVFEEHEFFLNKGDSVYFFSDGYADQFGVGGKKMMVKKFKEALLSIQDQNMDKQCDYLDSFYEEWKGDTDQIDDVLVIGIRV